MHVTILPTGEPLAGRWVRLDLLGEADIDQMYPLLRDPAVYAHGYVMHRRPLSLEDSRNLTRKWDISRARGSAGEAGSRPAGRGKVRSGSRGVGCLVVGCGDAAEGDFEAQGAELADVVGDLPAGAGLAFVVVRSEVGVAGAGGG